MKRSLLLVLAMGLMTTVANAGQLYMTFADGSTEKVMAPSGTVQIDVYFRFDAADYYAKDTMNSHVSSLNLRYRVYGNNPDPSSPPFNGAGVDMSSMETLTVQELIPQTTAGWDHSATDGLGGDLHDFYSSAVDPTVSLACPPGGGTFLMHSIVVHYTSFALEWYVSFLVNQDGGGPLPQVKDGTADWDFQWYGYGPSMQREYNLGTGDPGDEHNPHTWHGYEMASPLIFRDIPEPTSIALLALGSLAILRRR